PGCKVTKTKQKPEVNRFLHIEPSLLDLCWTMVQAFHYSVFNNVWATGIHVARKYKENTQRLNWFYLSCFSCTQTLYFLKLQCMKNSSTITELSVLFFTMKVISVLL